MSLGIKYTSKFKSDLKPYKHDKKVNVELQNILYLLKYSLPIPDKYNNHPLHGNYECEWDCHIRPNVVLLYHIENGNVVCVRIGSHSKLGLTESTKHLTKLLIKESESMKLTIKEDFDRNYADITISVLINELKNITNKYFQNAKFDASLSYSGVRGSDIVTVKAISNIGDGNMLRVAVTIYLGSSNANIDDLVEYDWANRICLTTDGCGIVHGYYKDTDYIKAKPTYGNTDTIIKKFENICKAVRKLST